jgi:hypothetical protein
MWKRGYRPYFCRPQTTDSRTPAAIAATPSDPLPNSPETSRSIPRSTCLPPCQTAFRTEPLRRVCRDELASCFLWKIKSFSSIALLRNGRTSVILSIEGSLLLGEEVLSNVRSNAEKADGTFLLGSVRISLIARVALHNSHVLVSGQR